MAQEIAEFCATQHRPADPWADVRADLDRGASWQTTTWLVTFEDSLPLGEVIVETGNTPSDAHSVVLVSDGLTAPRRGRVECSRCAAEVALEIGDAALRLWRAAEPDLDRETRERLAPEIAGDDVELGQADRWFGARLARVAAAFFTRADAPSRPPLLPMPGGTVPAPLSVVLRSSPRRLVVTTPKGLTEDEAVEFGAADVAARLRAATREQQAADVEHLQRYVAAERDTIQITKANAREVRKKRRKRAVPAQATDDSVRPWVALLGPEAVAAALRLPGFAVPFMRPRRGHPALPEQRVADRVLELLGWDASSRRAHVLADVLLVKASSGVSERRAKVPDGARVDPDQHRRIVAKNRGSAALAGNRLSPI